MPGRSLYSHEDLRRAFEPRSIAVIGASARAGAFGNRLLVNLKSFDGAVFPVNENYDSIEGLRCFKSLADLPETPDCVIVAAPKAAVETLLTDATRRGVGGVVIFASGFAETGEPEDRALQNRLAAIVLGTTTRLIGPNSIGLCAFASGASMTFSPLPRAIPGEAHAIGIASQSGALGLGLLQAAEHGASVSHMLATGNSSDVDVADCVNFLAHAPACRAIACLFEGLSEPSRLIQAARAARDNGKPLVVFKIATGEQGAAAALSHTGSLAGSNALYRQALREAGAVLVDGIDDVMETAAFFAKAPAPRAAGAAVVSTSGGGAIMCADFAEANGVPLPQPSEAALAVLKRHVPNFGSTRNPCDVTAQVLNDPGALKACAEAILRDEEVGAIVYPHPLAYESATPRIAMFGDLAAAAGKVACVVWMNEWLEGPGAVEAERNPKVAVFRNMRRCFSALAQWRARADLLGRPRETILTKDLSAQRAAVRELFEHAPARIITETAAKRMLAAYGVPVVEERLVGSIDDAVAAAASIGYPVAVKVDSEAIAHKTEAGVVRLNISDADSLTRAYADITANADKAAPGAPINGVVVQPMTPQGVEVIVGARVDPHFGPLVLVGLGGVMVELFKDVATAFAPIDAAEARRLLLNLTAAKLLTGFRGSTPVNLDRLAEVVASLSRFVADFAEEIAEIDINPVICSGAQIVAVDALIVRKSSTR